MEKQKLWDYLDAHKDSLADLADWIFDHPELGEQEFEAASKLTTLLEEKGFLLERGIAGLPTAWRATYQQGKDGPRIGLLCEYDALEGIGHACAHHIQGPAIVYAAMALKECLKDKNFSLVVYGTPAEETTHGKLRMIEQGYFQDIDVALMTHGSPSTTVDVKSMALNSVRVIFHGKKAHAALKPEAGRSALDALLICFQGVEFLREHVDEDTRMHYTIGALPGPANVVPDKAVGDFKLRSYSRARLDKVMERFEKIVQGAALIADVSYEMTVGDKLDSKVPVLSLNDLLMKQARELDAPRMTPPRQKTGSSDFGNVMYRVPGSCIRVAMVPPEASAHSDEFLAAGKTEETHAATVLAAKVLAGAALEMIKEPQMIADFWAEHTKNKAQL